MTAARRGESSLHGDPFGPRRPCRRRHASVRDGLGSPALALFLALFASQSGALVLSPILSDVADDFGG